MTLFCTVFTVFGRWGKKSRLLKSEIEPRDFFFWQWDRPFGHPGARQRKRSSRHSPLRDRRPTPRHSTPPLLPKRRLYSQPRRPHATPPPLPKRRLYSLPRRPHATPPPLHLLILLPLSNTIPKLGKVLMNINETKKKK